jgi:N5-glutamine AdoMet-dependent methyltransferase PrmC (HemK)-like protein
VSATHAWSLAPSACGVAAGASIAETRRVLTQAFRDAALDSPELDARVLIGHALALDHAGLAVHAASGSRNSGVSNCA